MARWQCLDTSLGESQSKMYLLKISSRTAYVQKQTLLEDNILFKVIFLIGRLAQNNGYRITSAGHLLRQRIKSLLGKLTHTLYFASIKNFNCFIVSAPSLYFFYLLSFSFRLFPFLFYNLNVVWEWMPSKETLQAVNYLLSVTYTSSGTTTFFLSILASPNNVLI